MVIGNLLMQPMFASAQAVYFGSFDVQLFVELANRHIATFGLSGVIARFILWQYPSTKYSTVVSGLCIWLLSVITLASYSIFGIPFLLYETLISTGVSIGGGIYFWGTVDDVIVGAKEDQYLALAYLGIFSSAYMYITHWIYIDFAQVTGGFVFVNIVLLMLVLPTAILLLSGNIILPQILCEARPEHHTTSFIAHVFFILLFGIFRQIPTLTLYLRHHHTQDETNLLLFYKATGVILGEFLASSLPAWEYIHLPFGFILPLAMFHWMENADDFSSIIPDMFIFGLCIGVLGVWVYHRILIEWRSNNSSLEYLRRLLFLLALALLPGDFIVNLVIFTNDERFSSWSSKQVLEPAFGISCAVLIALFTHAVLYKRE